MPKIHGIYLDVLFNEKFIVVDLKDNEYVSAIWLSATDTVGSFLVSFPASAMGNDIYCGQASELMVALL